MTETFLVTCLLFIFHVQNVMGLLKPVDNISAMWQKSHFFRNTSGTFLKCGRNNGSLVTRGEHSCHGVHIIVFNTGAHFYRMTPITFLL